MILKVTANTEGGRRTLKRLADGMSIEKIDRVVGRVAAETFAHVVKATPKRWFGQVRRSWQIRLPAPGVRHVINENKIMLFLEEGTANQGQGWIYPRTKKFLYIPLNRKAAMGWHEGLKYGRDYILRKKVRGIKPRRIVARERILTAERLLVAMRRHIQRIVDGSIQSSN